MTEIKMVGTNNDRKTLKRLSAVLYFSFVDRGLFTKMMPIKDEGISLLLIVLIVLVYPLRSPQIILHAVE